MRKFEIKICQEREATFCIEAHDEREAQLLFISKMYEDDSFIDKVYEVLEGGLVKEEVTATPIQYDGNPDYTYEQMKEREE